MAIVISLRKHDLLKAQLGKNNLFGFLEKPHNLPF
jgi:hypothetical protein